MNKKKLHSRPQAIFLMGPTASGKTKFAIALSQYLPVEIISVDSALIYRGMDIGTNKPSSYELKHVVHHLIDIRDPSEHYSAAYFCNDAIKSMKNITNKGSIPLLVGGTMFYFKALLEGLSPLPSTDPCLRIYLENEAKNKGWRAMYQQLQQIDEVTANRIHPNDKQRILRALEVFLISGYTLTELIKVSGKALDYKIHQFALFPCDKCFLYQRIANRFYRMLAAGFEQEVSKLFFRNDLNREMSSLRCVGYRQMLSYLAGEINYDSMVYSGVCATQKLAKNQMNWLKKWRNIYWLDSTKSNFALESILKVVNKKV